MAYTPLPGIRTTVHFQTSANLPSLIYKARQMREISSNAGYMRRAIIEALSRDLGLSYEELLDIQPPDRPMDWPLPTEEVR